MTRHSSLLSISLVALFAGCFCLAGQLQASDLAKEKRWAAQVEDALLDGEPVYLNDGISDFLTIETLPESDAGRAAIVMHGSGVHPDWPTVVQPLRVALAEQGWTTLSIQMPILANEAEYHEYAAVYPEAPARILAAAKHLQDNGNKRIVLISHSLGAGMTAYSLSQWSAEQQQQFGAFVAVGMSAGGQQAVLDHLAAMRKVTIPVLDLSGQNDLPDVVNSTQQRAGASAHNAAYAQHVEDGAGHFFEGFEAPLIDVVSGWLEENAK